MKHVDIAKQQPALSGLEWKVVALAIREARRERFSGPGAFSRVARWLWAHLSGEPPKRPLGDPRLDALRRFVEASRRGPKPARKMAGELIGFGYSCAQLSAVAELAR